MIIAALGDNGKRGRRSVIHAVRNRPRADFSKTPGEIRPEHSHRACASHLVRLLFDWLCMALPLRRMLKANVLKFSLRLDIRWSTYRKPAIELAVKPNSHLAS